jgi:protein TonB
MMDVSAGLMAGHILSQQKPTYPDQARRAHVQGTVVLQAVIDKQGNITDLRVIGGPTLLQGSAMEAVKTWRYRPYVLNGEPVEVETQINVVYSMGYK